MHGAVSMLRFTPSTCAAVQNILGNLEVLKVPGHLLTDC